MNPKDLDHPAFPVPNEHYPNGDVQYGHNGMYLRQWYAGLAMQTLIGIGDDSPEVNARAAFAIADAMILEGRK